VSSQQLHRVWLIAVGLALIATGTCAAAVSGREQTSGSLALNASLTLTSRLGACASPPGIEICAERRVSGLFPGLGAVSGTYAFYGDNISPPCEAGSGKALSYPIRLDVPAKGEIHLAVAAGPCVEEQAIRVQTQTFTVTGGTGVYAGAMGSGSLARVLGEETSSGRAGRETWTGTLTVPGLDFDVTAPILAGASSRTVRARRGVKRARVTYHVTAQDDRDGLVQATCAPRSGSRFRLGRTRVFCDAVDSSANVAGASFTINVKKGH